jgi:hypothetical protein
MKLRGMGLVCAGGANQSFLARFPAFVARLGPIKSTSYRVARQTANSIRAGFAVSHYSALMDCPIVWISVPELVLDRTLQEMAVQTPLHNRGVVLFGCTRDSSVSDPLLLAGARVASLNPVPDTHESIFVAEGNPDMMRNLRTLLHESKRKLIELKPGTKPLFFAGIHVAAPLLLPWIAAAMESLRASGFTRAEAASVGEFLGVDALRKYVRAGAKAWNPKTAASLRHVLDHDLQSIRSLDPKLAELYEQGIRMALDHFLTPQARHVAAH